MKFDFNKPLVNLDETPMRDNLGEVFTMNKTLANHLAQMTKFSEPVKLMEWCRELWKTGILDLDKSDQQKFRGAILSFEHAFSYVVGQLIDHFDDIRDAKTSNKTVVEPAAVTNNNGVSAEPLQQEQQ